MSSKARWWPLLLCLGQVASSFVADDIYETGPDIKGLKLLKKVEPAYSEQAKREHVQGAVLLEIVINTDGKPSDITVLSPLGFGLDEAAQEAIQGWRFKPGEKDGVPVRVRVTVLVNFRLQQVWFEAKHEERRTAYNAALRKLTSGDPKKVDEAVETVLELSQQKFPAAAYLHGIFLREGKAAAERP